MPEQPTVDSEMVDLALRHEIRIRRYSAGLLAKVNALLDAADTSIKARILAAIKTGAADLTEKRLASLLEGIGALNSAVVAEIADTVTGNLRAFAESEAAWQARALNAASPIKFKFDVPGLDQVVAAVEQRPVNGYLVDQYFKAMETGRLERIETTVRAGMVEGASIPEMVASLDEAAETSKNGAATAVRTLTTHYASAARDEFFKANSKVVKQVKWVSTLDGRTSAVCRHRDGKLFPVDSGPRPPAHPGCRSTTVPVVKSWKELGLDEVGEDESLSERPFIADTRRKSDIPKSERAALTGKVSGDVTYADWLPKQSPKFQDEVLGKTRGKLFREGGLTLDRFVDDRGVQYTLDELKAREAAAFSAAGV